MTQHNYNWNNALKIAIINEEIDTIAKLHAELPDTFETVEDAKATSALIAEAIKLLSQKREEISHDIEQTKKVIAYQKNQLGSYDHSGDQKLIA